MSRVNTILSNTTEDLSSLPGYGLHYTGEQEFYAFYVNLGAGAPAPFVSGTNLILESRKAFLASPAAAILGNATTQFNGSVLSCLGSTEVTGRTTGSTPSETGIDRNVLRRSILEPRAARKRCLWSSRRGTGRG